MVQAVQDAARLPPAPRMLALVNALNNLLDRSSSRNYPERFENFRKTVDAVIPGRVQSKEDSLLPELKEFLESVTLKEVDPRSFISWRLTQALFDDVVTSERLFGIFLEAYRSGAFGKEFGDWDLCPHSRKGDERAATMLHTFLYETENPIIPVRRPGFAHSVLRVVHDRARKDEDYLLMALAFSEILDNDNYGYDPNSPRFQEYRDRYAKSGVGDFSVAALRMLPKPVVAAALGVSTVTLHERFEPLLDFYDYQQACVVPISHITNLVEEARIMEKNSGTSAMEIILHHCKEGLDPRDVLAALR